MADRTFRFSASVVFLCLAMGWTGLASAACPALPYTLTNGTVADATKVQSNLNALSDCINAAPAGAPNSVQTNGGSSSFGSVGPLTNGQVIIGSTGNAPQAAYLTAGAGVSITNAPGSVTISATGTAASYYSGSSTTINIDPGVPMTPLDSSTITIPASSSTRKFIISAYFQFTGSHGIGSAIHFDGAAYTQRQKWAGSGDPDASFSSFGPLIVTVPGDGNSHTISIYVSDAGNTGAVYFYNRWILAQPLS